MGKLIQVLNLETGLRWIEMPYTQEQEDKAKAAITFVHEGVKYSGWCTECRRPVRAEQGEWIDVDCDGLGHVSARVRHKHCGY